MTAYQYPPDEFDSRADSAAPVGVHRARPTRWSRIWPYIAIGLAAAATLATLLLLTSRYGGTSGPALVGGGEVAETVAPTDLPTAVADNEIDVDAFLAMADLSTPVTVLNDRAPNGEAGRGQSALQARGFTAVTAETAGMATEYADTSVLFKPGYEDTARAVAAVLNIPLHRMWEAEDLTTGDVTVIVRAPFELDGAAQTQETGEPVPALDVTELPGE